MSKAPQQPFFSVVVPAYNTRQTIAETLDSVLAQTYAHYEIIVVDDGSPDNVAEFVRQHYGKKVTLVRQPNAGLAAARNAGIKVAKGDYIAFLDSDDAWLPKKLERQATQIAAHPDGTVFYTNCYFLENGQRTGQWTDLHQQQDGDIALSLIKRQVMLPVLTTVVRHGVLQQAGGFREELRQVEDYDLWLRLAAAGHSFYGLPEALALYRINPAGLSQNTLLMAQTQLSVYKRLAQGVPQLLKSSINQQIIVFELEALHLQRKTAIAGHRRGLAAQLTLRMIPYRPTKTAVYLVTAVILLVAPSLLAAKLS